MYCKGHSRDGSKVAEGNHLADCQARKVALYEAPSLQMPLIWTGPVEQRSKCQHPLDHRKSKRFPEKSIYFCFIVYGKAFDCVSQ